MEAKKSGIEAARIKEVYRETLKEAYGDNLTATIDAAQKGLDDYKAGDWNRFADDEGLNIRIKKTEGKLTPTIADKKEELVERAGKILSEFFEGKTPASSSEKQMIQVTGGAGSGKTKNIKEWIERGQAPDGTKINDENTVYIDVPEFMERIAVEKGWSEEDKKRPEYSSQLRHEASILAKTAAELAQDEGLDIIYEGADKSEMARQTEEAKVKGYKVKGIATYTENPKDATRNVITRFDEKGGPLPPIAVVNHKAAVVAGKENVLTDGKTNVKGIVEAWQKAGVDGTIFETSGEKPTAVARFNVEKGLEILDRDKYNTFKKLPDEYEKIAGRYGSPDEAEVDILAGQAKEEPSGRHITASGRGIPGKRSTGRGG